MKSEPLAHYYELIALLSSGPLGRRTVVLHSSMTESTVRTHLRHLEELGYIHADKQGTELTDRARHDFEELLSRVRLLPPPHLGDLRVDEHASAALVTKAAGDLQKSVYYRDQAVRAGATGAILLIHRGGTWSFPEPPIELSSDYPQDATALERLLDRLGYAQREDDGLALSFGPDQSTAIAGLWSILASLIPSPRRLELHTSK